MDFDVLLSRAADETLQELLGGKTVKLVTLLDPNLASPTKLRELAIGLHSREGLLLSNKTRNLLFDLMPAESAQSLSNHLGLAQNGSPFEALRTARINRASEREKSLFDFFGLTPPDLVEPTTRSPSAQLIEADYPLFQHQRDAARRISGKLLTAPHRVILHMPTGAGKTRTAMHLVSMHLREREDGLVVWLAHSEELCDQAAGEFAIAWRSLGNRDLNIYRFWGDHELDVDPLNTGFFVGSLAKIYRRIQTSIDFINKLGNKCTFAIMDEAHQAIADTYKMILNALIIQHPNTALLGLTATPGRTWADIGEDEKLASFFGRQKVSLNVEGYANPVDYLVAQGYLARVTFDPLYSDGLQLSDQDRLRIENELEIPRSILDRLADDEQRNLQIILKIEDLIERHQRVLVFASTVAHARLLATVLRARGHDAVHIDASTPSGLRTRIIEDFKSELPGPRILCNYDVLTAGFDAPRTSAALIARPTKSLVLYSQMVGRASRGVIVGGNSNAEIITVIDTNLAGFGSLADSFLNWEDVWQD